MVKKKESSPLFSEDEMNDLLKDAEKREAPIKKKPIEKIATPKTIAKLPKPVKKEVKKEQEKIVKQIKENEPKKEVKQPIPEKTPDIEYVLKTVTKYDVNWYYLKEKLVKFEKWLVSPYTRYANWFNKKFNSSKIEVGLKHDLVTVEDLYEDLPEMERKIHLEVNKIIKENVQKELLK
jgi:hypothetical protein